MAIIVVNVTTTKVRPLVIELLAIDVRMIGYEHENLVGLKHLGTDDRGVCSPYTATAAGRWYPRPGGDPQPDGCAAANRHAYANPYSHADCAAADRYR